MLRRLCVIAAIFCLPLLAFSQESVEYSDRAEEVFKEGLSLFGAGSFREAERTFDRIIQDYPASQRVTAAWVMKGKAYLRLDENLEAARTLKAFVVKFPSSSYRSDAEAMLGEIYVRIGRYEEAVASYQSAWRRLPLPKPDRLLREIVAALDSLLDRHVVVPTLQRMIAESPDASERAFLWLKVAEKEASRNNFPAARTALDTISFRYPDNSFRDRIEAVRIRLRSQSAVKLGVLLPLMRNADPSAVKEIGTEVFDGIQFALEENDKDPTAGVRVALEARDTERDSRLAVKGVEELAAMPDVIGIIGPVFSTMAVTAAGSASDRRIPLISPTANANGIAAAGPWVFQANPDYDLRGRAMAKFAVEVKGFRTLAVLAPGDTYAKYMAEGFVAEATRLGAKVLATVWYQRGAQDLKPQLAEIRRAGMLATAEPSVSFAGKMKPTDLMRFAELGVPVKRIDSLMNKGSIVPVSWLLGPMPRDKIDSLGFNFVFDETKIDSLQYPVSGIQAIYLPISSPEEIAVVSSQIVYFNFQTQMLGSGEWNNFTELNANRRYARGVMFEADSFVDSNSISFTDFLAGFSARYKKRPSRNTLYGYDTARLVLSVMRSGATTRDALCKALTGVQDFQGLHSKIGFSPGRVNAWMSVLQYADDAIQKVDEVHVDAEDVPARPGGSPSK